MSTPNFWTSLASFCQELAPVAGPLLSAVGDTASAVDRAGRASGALRSTETDVQRLLRADDRG